jgi:mannose-6-phosphate isomerase-like protein (cupin superfamily)
MEKVMKTWGYEHWFVNTARYCGKMLFIEKGKWSSEGRYHYHKLKDETFFVIEGELHLDYVKDGVTRTEILKQYDSFRVEQLVKHRFTAISEGGCKFVEASTTHRDTDSYRCYFDESKTEWVEV